jgi:uracil-DNA glycosylase family 4
VDDSRICNLLSEIIMAKQKAFFLSPLEIYQQEHPEFFEKKKKSSSKPKKTQVYNCDTCGLSSKCKHPKIQRFGKGKKNILLVGLCPGRVEDRIGTPFVGPSGDFLKEKFELLGIDLDQDCTRTNVVQCFPGLDKSGDDKKPTQTQILSCAPNLQKDVEEVQPKLIIALGSQAIKSLVDTKGLSSFSVSGTHGQVFPIHKYNAWVGCSYHPAFFLKQKKKDKGKKNDDIIFLNDMADILAALDEPLPKPLTTEGNKLITDYKEAIDYIHYIIEAKKPSCHDFETINLECYNKDSRILTISLTNEVKTASCIPIDFKVDGKKIFTESQLEKVISAFNEYLRSDIPKIVQNYYMEELWGRNILGQSMNNFIWDTMVTAHVINCQRGTTSLGYQAYQLAGHDYKKMVNTEKLEEESLEKISDYNCFDVRYTLMSYHNQKRKLTIDLDKKRFNDWLTGCLPSLANLKDRGAIIDVSVLNNLDKKYQQEKKDLFAEMKDFGAIKKFEELKDDKGEKLVFNPNSTHHLQTLFYDLWKEPKVKLTKTGASTDKDTLLTIAEKTRNKDVKSFIEKFLRYKKCDDIPKKSKEYRRLLDPNNKVHSSFNMNVAATYRSSSNGPNLQNVFKHDEELQIFRKCMVPRRGNIILEVDYSGMEVRGIAMLSRDKELINQLIKMELWNKKRPNEVNPWDTHRRWGARLYEVAIGYLFEDDRYHSKNGFVFPSIYGSQPSAMASYEGFRGRVSEKRISEVFEQFWSEYPDIRRWQDEQIDYYNKHGCYTGKFGCKRPGPLSDYQLFNNDNQGMSFLLLLDALERIDEEMIRRGMESYAFIEIHDSITFDVVPEEVFDVVELSNEILLAKRFDWQGEVPLAVDWEASYTDWYSKSKETFKELVGV